MRHVKAKPDQRSGRVGENKCHLRVRSKHGCRGLAFRNFFISSGQVQCIIASKDQKRLDLHRVQTVLPDNGEGGDTILTEVDQDVPR